MFLMNAYCSQRDKWISCTGRFAIELKLWKKVFPPYSPYKFLHIINQSLCYLPTRIAKNSRGILSLFPTGFSVVENRNHKSSHNASHPILHLRPRTENTKAPGMTVTTTTHPSHPEHLTLAKIRISIKLLLYPILPCLPHSPFFPMFHMNPYHQNNRQTPFLSSQTGRPADYGEQKCRMDACAKIQLGYWRTVLFRLGISIWLK